MKWFLYLILFLQSHNSFVNSSTKNLTHFNPNYNYLTYHGGGRFGDRLIAYMHAKWLSYKYNIPMLYIPFAYSDDLILDDIELQYRNHGFNKFYRRTFENEFLILDSNNSCGIPTIYILNYFPECKWELNFRKNTIDYKNICFEVDWKDPLFKKQLQALIKPKSPLPTIQPTKDKITIALHLREGRGFDSEETKKKWLYKIPPIEFYISSLYWALETFQDKPLYCYVFTDATDPA